MLAALPNGTTTGASNVQPSVADAATPVPAVSASVRVAPMDEWVTRTRREDGENHVVDSAADPPTRAPAEEMWQPSSDDTQATAKDGVSALSVGGKLE